MGVLDRIGASGVALQARGSKHVFGSADGIDAMGTMAKGAKQSITFEVFKVSDEAVAGPLRGRAADDVLVRVHGDTDAAGEFAIESRDGIALTYHGGSPLKLHTKAMAVDHRRGLLSSATPVPGLRQSDAIDFTVLVGMREALAIEAMTRAAISGNPKEVARTAAAAARLGIFLNDPAHGVVLLRKRINELIDTAEHSIFASSKILGDEKSVERLARAIDDRDVDVVLETSSKALPEHVKAARDAGLDVSWLVDLEKGTRYTHGNLLVRDMQEAYMGTAQLSPRGMGRPQAERGEGFAKSAREMGWVTKDRAAIRGALEAVASVPGSAAGKFLERHG